MTSDIKFYVAPTPEMTVSHDASPKKKAKAAGKMCCSCNRSYETFV